VGPDQEGLTYKAAGVDIDAGNELVDRIRDDVKRTMRPGVLGGLGGFGGLFEVPVDRYRRPVLVSGTDGVGTKLKLAIETGRHDGIGIDLVAMCANDVLVTGAEPLYFLDYYATGQLDVEVAAAVIRGIAEGCHQAGAALIGGETAEMPGMYAEGHYDLAGFCVGVVEKDEIIDGSRVAAGDALIALGASGPHSNGYSLIRKVLERAPDGAATEVDGQPVADLLMAPTRIYAKPVLDLVRNLPVHAMAHITGGGLPENLPRVLPEGLGAQLQPWDWPAVFRWLQQTGGIAEDEMLRTFNCGVGMVLVVPAAEADAAVQRLQQTGEQAWRIGEIVTADADAPRVRVAQA